MVNHLRTKTSWQITKSSVYAALIASFVLLTILPGAPISEAVLHAQRPEAFQFGFSPSPVVDRGDQSEAGLAKGKFLVASRELIDPNFSETVVLLLEYSRSGAMGVVVNRPTQVRLSTALPEMEGVQDLTDTLFAGGPVARNQILFLIRSGHEPEGSRRVFDDIYVSSSRALLQKMVDGGDSGKTFRLYAGYAGWAPGQLDREVAMGGWHVLQADVATVFEKAPSEIWPELIHRSSALWVRLLHPSP
jgi:putative transcriptional regulator